MIPHDHSAPPNGTKNVQPSPTSDCPPPKVGDTTAGDHVPKVEKVQELDTTWVFQPEGENDKSRICVEDAFHCISLLKLQEQLYRPANDPLGIR
jgi:hypothetical protein